MEQTPLRLVRADHIGKLVVLKGIVTRASDVKPLAKVVTYTCDQCQCEIYQTVPGKTFMPLFRCTSEVCRRNTNPGVLYMQTRGSKFVKFQEIRIQEPMEQVPMGHIPRCINVRLQGDLTQRCSPGDVVTICGIFLPTLQNSVKGEVSLVAETYVEGLSIIHNNKGFSSFDVSSEVKAEVDKTIESGENIYDRLARSIAPEIYGMDDVKKALLLQMVGMPTRRFADGMKIRGDINVLLMGDPGVAKSQLLKHVASMAPRSVYTSGKGSTGVGLMAAVVKDPTTNEFILEGGSLVLADMGICCIDEFDKMEDTDRTAIHEVMEQQTISVAKAGITTTLNARTAILAAANPSSGRYLVSRTPSENIGMPAALLSRFDLIFILLDVPEEALDRAKADHIIAVHVEADSVNSGKHKKKKKKKKKGAAGRKATLAKRSAGDEEGGEEEKEEEEEEEEEVLFEPYTTEFIRAYLTKVKDCVPTIPPDSRGYVVNAYVNMRKENQGGANGDTYARLRFSSTVSSEDIDEAIRLMAATKASIAKKPRASAQNDATDSSSMIFSIIRECNEKSNGAGIPYADVLIQILHKGFSETQLRDTIKEYEGLGIITLSADSSVITFNEWD